MIVDKLEAWIRDGMPTTPERVERARALMRKHADMALGNWSGEPEENRPLVTLSSSFWCSRKIHYDLIRAPKERVAPRALDAFGIGQMVEAMLVSKCILAGLPVMYPTPYGEQYRHHMMVAGQLLRGSVDMVLEDDQGRLIPVEIKSMADFGWDSVKRSGKIDDTFGHAGQLGRYIHLMDAPYGIYLGVKKSTGHTLEIHVQKDQAVFEETTRSLQEAMAGLPAMPAWAATKKIAGCEQIDSVRCGYCPYRAMCFPGFEQLVVGGKVVYRTAPTQES
ncbi:MAG: PD-(D/E)XK nuclease family protein [Candidatus Sericytochromatia bacterium]|nr:PD-(D/E)XK nuclease family protein [Candidatus Sericytochromatia bacterium]